MRVSFNKTFQQIFTSNDKGHIETTNSSYKVVASIYFPGTNCIGNVLDIKAIAGGNTANVLGKIKVYDYTNSKTIVEKTGIDQVGKDFVDLGDFSNLPEEEAILEIQIANAGSDSFYIANICVCLE